MTLIGRPRNGKILICPKTHFVDSIKSANLKSIILACLWLRGKRCALLCQSCWVTSIENRLKFENCKVQTLHTFSLFKLHQAWQFIKMCHSRLLSQERSLSLFLKDRPIRDSGVILAPPKNYCCQRRSFSSFWLQQIGFPNNRIMWRAPACWGARVERTISQWIIGVRSYCDIHWQ